MMKKVIKKLRNAVNVVLLAPVKFPAKVMQIMKYVALGLGIIDKVMEDPKGEGEEDHEAVE